MLPRLFSPFQLRGLDLKNRIILPAMGVFLVEADGTITEKTLAYYQRRAQGGAAMVMVEASAVAPEGIVSPYQMRIYDDTFIPGLERIARTIKKEGARAGIQIHHAGRQTSSKVIGRLPYAPSPLPCPAIKGDVEALDQAGIRRMIRLFGDAAQRAMEAGYELIEIHGAHGYLVNQFLSGFSNIREDEYGGDVARRCRFAVEVVQEVRRRIGTDVPVSFKISAQEFVPGGLTVDESIEIVKILEEAGIDAVQVSAGNDATPEWISQPMLMPRGCLVDSAHRIKQQVTIPVIAVGRINGPLLAEEILRENKADLICMGRALLADPELPNKAREGRIREIRRCVACNTCINSIFKKGQVECLVNPELSREQEMALHPITRAKKVLVVGGGPGGSEAAWVAASRGHSVELYEAAGSLGGQILIGAVSAHKKDLLNIVRFHEHQLQQHGVKCHFEHFLTAGDIIREGPDVVVLATGARPDLPPPIGAHRENVLTYAAAFNGTSELPRDLVIVGGGAVGCELALHLAQMGHTVTIMEMMERIGSPFEAMTRKLILGQIRSLGIGAMTRCRITGYDGRTIRYVDPEGNGCALEAPAVIFATGLRPADELYGPLTEAGLEVHKVGDCMEPRSIKEAIYEGALIGRRI